MPFKRRDELAGVRVDGADAAEAMIALGDSCLHGGRHAQAGQDVVEEGHDVVGAFGTAEGDYQDGVVVAGGVIEETHFKLVPIGDAVGWV